MRGLNRVMLLGNLGRDPEMKQLETGRARASFRVATSDWRNDHKTGEKIEHTEWHRVVAWGKTAELAGEFLRKGRRVLIEGRLQTRHWADAEGKERYYTEVVADSITFLDSPHTEAPTEAQAEAVS